MAQIFIYVCPLLKKYFTLFSLCKTSEGWSIQSVSLGCEVKQYCLWPVGGTDAIVSNTNHESSIFGFVCNVIRKKNEFVVYISFLTWQLGLVDDVWQQDPQNPQVKTPKNVKKRSWRSLYMFWECLIMQMYNIVWKVPFTSSKYTQNLCIK